MQTIAGQTQTSFGGDGEPAVNALFSDPVPSAVDARGNLSIADYEDTRCLTERFPNRNHDEALRELLLPDGVGFTGRWRIVGIPDKGPGTTPSGDLSTSSPLSARGISIATAKTSVNAGRHRRTYRQEPGHKGALAVRLRKLAIDGEKTLQGVAELAYQQSFQV